MKVDLHDVPLAQPQGVGAKLRRRCFLLQVVERVKIENEARRA